MKMNITKRSPQVRAALLKGREVNPEGPTLERIRELAQADANQHGYELAIGWVVNNDNGTKEYGYCPLAYVGDPAFVLEQLETVKPAAWQTKSRQKPATQDAAALMLSALEAYDEAVDEVLANWQEGNLAAAVNMLEELRDNEALIAMETARGSLKNHQPAARASKSELSRTLRDVMLFWANTRHGDMPSELFDRAWTLLGDPQEEQLPDKHPQTYRAMADLAKFESAPALAHLLLRIYEANRTRNNGSVMGEARMCNMFAMEAKAVLIEAGVLPAEAVQS